jgi:hypothetical protein
VVGGYGMRRSWRKCGPSRGSKCFRRLMRSRTEILVVELGGAFTLTMFTMGLSPRPNELSPTQPHDQRKARSSKVQSLTRLLRVYRLSSARLVQEHISTYNVLIHDQGSETYNATAVRCVWTFN